VSLVPGDRVRCPRCREAADDDAAWCSRCGAALAGEVLVIEPPNARDAPPVGHPGGSAPSGPRHRRRRRVDRRTVAGGVALAVVAAVVAVVGPWREGEGGTAAGPTSTTARSRGAATSRPSTTTTAIPPVFLTERTGGVRLVLARGGAVDVVDLDANTVSRHEVADLPAQNRQEFFPTAGLARRGDHLVFQGSDATFAVPLDFSRPPRRLAESALFLPSAVEDRVWLISRQGDGTPLAREFDTSGAATSPGAAVPPDWTPHFAVDGGLVLSRGDRFQVWDPASGRARFLSEPGAGIVAAGGSTVAWRFYCEGPFCPIHLTDLRTGRDRAVYVGHFGGAPEGAVFSPDGRTLATFVIERSGDEPRPALALLDVATGTVRLAARGGDYGQLSWSASGAWLFALGFSDGPPGIRAYRADLPTGLPAGLPVELGDRASGFSLLAW